jgi:hypothetical protein
VLGLFRSDRHAFALQNGSVIANHPDQQVEDEQGAGALELDRSGATG